MPFTYVVPMLFSKNHWDSPNKCAIMENDQIFFTLSARYFLQELQQKFECLFWSLVSLIRDGPWWILSSWLILSCYLRFVFFQTFFPISQLLKAELWFIKHCAFVIPRWVTFLPHNGCTNISHLLSCYQTGPETRNTNEVNKVNAQYTP